jgi:hypothetical protein
MEIYIAKAYILRGLACNQSEMVLAYDYIQITEMRQVCA